MSVPNVYSPNDIANPVGRGALVYLDYATNVDSDRSEHSVLFLPDSWDAMFELLVAPGVYMSKVREAYSNRPLDGWPFAAPITIHIEPLTVASSSNLATLSALSHLYPDLKAVVASSGALTSNEFRNRVIQAAQNPATAEQLDQAAQQHAAALAFWTARQKPTCGPSNPSHSSGGGARGGIADNLPQPASFNLPPPVAAHPLYFLAEYAIETRVLTIKYVPQVDTTTGYPQLGSASPRKRFQNEVTPVTINPVGFLDIAFIHFDMSFGTPRLDGTEMEYQRLVSQSHLSVALRRAEITMDYIENPTIMNRVLSDVAQSPGAAYHLVDGTLTSTGNALAEKSDPIGANRPTFDWPQHGLDPTVIIDSVLPSPFPDLPSEEQPDGPPPVMKTGDSGVQTLSDDPPAPSPCVIVYYVDGIPYYIVIKNYN